MIFSSFEFIFAFLPVVLVGYWLSCLIDNKAIAKLWLILSSLFFYGYWDWNYVFLIISSITGNFAFARFQLASQNLNTKRLLLISTILSNLLLLFYFKYLNFFFDNLAFMTEGYQIEKIILPIGLSFYTFQQISYQVDTFNGRSPKYNLIDYSLFVAFFPQLIAGPIVHHKEMLPQFVKNNFGSPKLRNLLLGFCVFSVGVFKKSVLADNFATYADPVFNGVSTGTIMLTTFDAWHGAVAYSLQLYFDFSGYSDMAIGLGIMFGIKLPFNFFSPLKSKNMVDFWRRWHISLTREVNNLLYNPISLSTTRYVMRKRIRRFLTFILSVAAPTIFIWFIVGAWHGAGWTFIVMGLAFGVCISVNHFSRQFILNNSKLGLSRIWKLVPTPIWILCNFTAYLLIMVLFRSEDFSAASKIYQTMFGYTAATGVENSVSSYGILDHAWLVSGLMIIWFLPNTVQYFCRYRVGIDVFGWHEIRKKYFTTYRMSYLHVIFCAILMMFGLLAIAEGTAEFLYFDF